MGAMTEAAQVGKRQEILPEVFNAESDATPFFSRLKTGKKPDAMLATWQAEVYPAVASTGTLDNTPVTTTESVGRELLSGCNHLFRRPWGVGKLATLGKLAGVKDEAARQMYISLMLVKRMIEQQALSTDDCAQESGSTPWTMRGAFSWLQSSAQTNLPVPAAVRPASATRYTGALASLTETAFRTMLIAASNAINQPVNLEGWCGDDLKALIDDFTNIYPVASTSSQPRSAYRIEGNSEYKNVVEMLSFSSGKVAVMPNSFLARTTSTGVVSAYSAKSGVFLNMDMWDIGFMESPANENLPIDGSGKRGFVDATLVVRCKNPLGQISVLANRNS